MGIVAFIDLRAGVPTLDVAAGRRTAERPKGGFSLASALAKNSSFVTGGPTA